MLLMSCLLFSAAAICIVADAAAAPVENCDNPKEASRFCWCWDAADDDVLVAGCWVVAIVVAAAAQCNGHA